MELFTRIRVDGQKARAEIPEMEASYDRATFNAWKKAGCPLFDRDPKHTVCEVIGVDVKGPLLNRLGGDVIMGKQRSAYYHQPASHFAEVLLGILLVDRLEYPGDRIVYENWCASAKDNAYSQALGYAASAEQWRATGTHLLLDSFTPVFFEDMAVLMEMNGIRHDANVDLFASDPAKRECGFFEAKREEPLEAHQKKFLGFVAFLVEHMKERVLVDPTTLVRAGVVRFFDELRSGQERKDAYSTEFEIPNEWSTISGD